LSGDPLGSGYGYAGGNPVNFVDPSGLSATTGSEGCTFYNYVMQDWFDCGLQDQLTSFGMSPAITPIIEEGNSSDIGRILNRAQQFVGKAHDEIQLANGNLIFVTGLAVATLSHGKIELGVVPIVQVVTPVQQFAGIEFRNVHSFESSVVGELTLSTGATRSFLLFDAMADISEPGTAWKYYGGLKIEDVGLGVRPTSVHLIFVQIQPDIPSVFRLTIPLGFRPR
jgi:hypothetical protein